MPDAKLLRVCPKPPCCAPNNLGPIPELICKIPSAADGPAPVLYCVVDTFLALAS